MKLAPIVLFVYNRLDHTEQTIEALQKNHLANESELFIYSDAAKNEDVIQSVIEVRRYLKTIDGFKSITVIEREKNWGLASSIIDGVTTIVNKYGKIIVLEDDLVTSPYFLTFMNDALEMYKDKEKVWHITGWNYAVEANLLDDSFLWRLMNYWGWATWKDNWRYFEKNVNKSILEFSKSDIKRFDLEGYEPYWKQVIANKNNEIDSWAVFWYISIFKANGLCLNPTVSFVKNIGFDGSGIHCGVSELPDSELNKKHVVFYPEILKENPKAVKVIQNYLKKSKISLWKRIKNKFFRYLYGK